MGSTFAQIEMPLGLVCAQRSQPHAGPDFSGLAILLWSALPVVDGRYIGVMWGLPSLFLGLGVACGVWARSFQTQAFWDVLKEQIQLDILMLEQAKTP